MASVFTAEPGMCGEFQSCVNIVLTGRICLYVCVFVFRTYKSIMVEDNMKSNQVCLCVCVRVCLCVLCSVSKCVS